MIASTMAKPPLTPSALNDLVGDLERRRKEIEEDARAIARVQKMMRERKNGPNAEPLVQLELGADDVGFSESVRRTARQFGQQSFTVPMVEEQLKKQDVRLPGKKTRPRISMVLKKMCDDHELVKVKGGRGSTPHVYRVA